MKTALTQEQINEYTRVAFYYYKGKMTQDAIAKRMNMSRQRVNRILNACTENGIVEIKIPGMAETNIELENTLEEKYHLKDVRIVDVPPEMDPYQCIGFLAGQYLESILKDGDIIGVSKGRTVAALAENLPEIQRKNLIITQLLGSENEPHYELGVNDIVYQFAKKLHAEPIMLHAPAIVQDASFKKSMQKEAFFKKTYEVVKSCDIAVVGIGSRPEHWIQKIGKNQISKEELNSWGQIFIGEVATHFFDKNGTSVEPPFRNRIIAISKDDFFNIQTRIGVACNAHKADTIRASLIGGYINTLIIDLATAKLLVKDKGG